MVHELQDLAKGMQRTSKVYQTHREAMGTQVMETLQEYSGIINTLPGLVRLHEEAMEFYNFSKDKDSVSVCVCVCACARARACACVRVCVCVCGWGGVVVF